jgi:hypothetical protein
VSCRCWRDWNQAALEKLHRKDHEAEHEDLQERIRQVLTDTAIPLSDRVRMASSFGAVFAVLFMSGDAFGDTTDVELGALLQAAIRDVLGL